MPAIDIRMRNAAEDREIVPVFMEEFEIRGGRVGGAGFLRKEILRNEAEVVANREHPARFGGRASVRTAGGGTCEDGLHGLEQG